MAFSTPRTLAQIRTLCKNLLMAPDERIWSNSTIDAYINDWALDLQTECGFMVSTATLTTSSTGSSFAWSDFASDILRPETIHWDSKLLVPRNEEELTQLNPLWRDEDPSTPQVLIPGVDGVFQVFPPPSTSGAVVKMRYTTDGTLVAGTSTTGIPTWAVFSAPYFVAACAYGKDGPVNDIQKSKLYRGLYKQRLMKIKSIITHFTPKHFKSFVPAGDFQSDILLARRR